MFKIKKLFLYNIQYLKYEKLKIDFLLHKVNYEEEIEIIADILGFDKLHIQNIDFSGCQLFDLEQRILVCFYKNFLILKISSNFHANKSP